nr:hypothetical protein [Bacteroidaceae bacterium]
LDEVTSYAALRKISVSTDAQGYHHLQLNNKDLFQYGVLDQGYWPDGLYTAPTDSAMLFDLQTAKDLGFNLIRKHQKVEPERWYWHADRLGLLVWQDMPALGREYEPYAPSTWSTTNGRAGASIRSEFQKEWREIIQQLYSHPCIVVWTPFDEATGQFLTSTIVELTKEADATRLVDAASGGNHKEGLGDFVDLHDFSTSPSIFLHDPRRPVVLGEFGAIDRNIEGHRWYDTNGVSNTTYNTELKLTTAYVKQADLLAALGAGVTATDNQPAAFAAAVYKQLTDVGTEVSGLITYDREVVKVIPEKVAAANQQLTALYGAEEPDPAVGIHSLLAPTSPSTTSPRIYDLSGRHHATLRRGFNLLRRSDGTYLKVICK